ISYDIAGFAYATYAPITRYGWSPGMVSAMFIVAGGLGLPGWWLGGRLADRRGRRVAATVFFLGLSVAEVAFYLGGPATLWPAFAAMVFCQGGKITVLRSWATELFPTNFRGAAAGWLTGAGTLGGTAGLARTRRRGIPVRLLCAPWSRPCSAGSTRRVCAGLDVAGPGEDETVLVVREGSRIVSQLCWTKSDPRGEVVAALAPYRGRLETVNVD